MLAPRLARALLIGFSGVAVIAGCNGGMSNSGGTNTGGSPTSGTGSLSPAASFYLVQDDLPLPSTILQFSRTANGSVSPASTITGPANVGFTALTVDGLGNLYVGGQLFGGTGSAGAEVGAEILVYAPGTSGTPTLTQTITSGLGALSTNSVPAMAVDSAQNLYAVTDVQVGSGASGHIYTGISVFDLSAKSSNPAPTKNIAGTATEIANPTQIAIDTSGNLYLANSAAQGPASILIFNSSTTGNVPPTSTLGGSNTTIYFAQGIALDGAGNIYVSSVAQNPQSIASLGGTPAF